MILLSLLWCLVPLVTGLVLISILWPSQPGRFSFPLRLSLSVGIGFGVLSCIYFLLLSTFGPSRGALIATQIALLGVLTAVFFYYRKAVKPVTDSELSSAPVGRSRLRSILSILFCAALISTAVTFIYISLRQPHGEWDAWAVYNMKARFLFRAGDHWRDLFSAPMEWAGPDYPLLIPATLAACWTLMGKETLIVPSLVAILFTLSTVGIVSSSISLLRTKTQGLLAGLILLCTPYIITHGADQYSDIPIGFFFLATLALIVLHDELGRTDFNFLILAGITAGLSAWTKNEGLLFIIAVLVSRFLVTFRRDGMKVYLKQIRFFATGLLPILLVVIFFKITISAHSGLLLPPEGPNLVAKFTDFSRYQTILDFFVTRGLGFGNWTVSIVPILAFYLLLVGATVEKKQRRGIANSLIALGIMVAGYFTIYVLSPRDLEWHIITSLDRLISQLWPSIVFVFFLIVRTPEQALTKKESVPASV